MRFILFVLVAAAALWSGYWFVGSRGIERGLTAWLDARTDEGWVAETGAVEVAGFPTDFDTTLRDVELADPATAVLVSLPELNIRAAAISPTRATLTFPPAFVVASPDERVDVAVDLMTAHLGFVPGPNLVVDDVDAEISGLALTSTGGWVAAADSVSLDLARQDGEEALYDLAFQADTLTPSRPLRLRIDRTGFLPETIETVRVSATVGFDRPWDRRALEERRPQPRRIDLDLLQATWGDLDLRVAGDLTIDSQGIPTGQVVVKATNWREMIAIAQSSGFLPESFAEPLEQALGFVAGLSGSPNTLDAPLDFVDGVVRFGPVPLGPAPRFYLR